MKTERIKSRYYLCGPMSGLPNFNREAFFDVAASLLEAGVSEVFSPAELSDEGRTWEDLMRICIGRLVKCDVLVVLPGWENSRGARLEMEIAEALGLRVVHAAKPEAEVCHG